MKNEPQQYDENVVGISEKRIAEADAIALPAVVEDLGRFYEAVEDSETESTPSPEPTLASQELTIRDRLLHTVRYSSLVVNAGFQESVSPLRLLIRHLESYLDGEDFPENKIVETLDLLSRQVSHADLWNQAAKGVVVRKHQDLPTPHEVQMMIRKLRTAVDGDAE